MKILVTSSRNLFVLDLVRKFAEQGHEVYACDTFSEAMAVAPAGRETQLDFAVLGDLLTEGIKQKPHSLHDLLHVHDYGHKWHDHLPTLWMVASYMHFAWLDRGKRAAILATMSDDIVWNGEPIDGMSAADAAALDDVHALRP